MADVCNLCAKTATLMCQRCNETYCSTNCQILDWRAHKKVCFQMPTLVPIKDANILSSRFIPTELNRSRNSTDNNKTTKRPLARNPLKISSDETPLSPTTDLKSSGIGKTKTPSVIDFTLKPKNTSIDNETLTKSNVSQCSKASTRAAPWETSYHYPENVFFEVLVQFIEQSDDSEIAWVTELKYESPLRKLLAEINRNIDINSDKCSDEEIYVGALIAAPFDNLYYRAKVVEVVEALKIVVVHLIDYGNLVELPFKDLRSPIPIMRNLNAYAFRIRLGKHVELETLLTIRVVGIEPNGVAIIEEKVPALMDSKVMPATLKTDDFLTNPTAALVKISKNARFALLCICNETVKAQLQEMDNLLKADSTTRMELEKPPKNGDYVIASVMNCWLRSIVIGTQHKDILVYTIDVGRISLVQEVLKIPQKFAALPVQIFAIEIKMILTNEKDLMNQLLENEIIYIKAQKNVKAADGRVPCYIQTNSDKNIAEVEAFNYSFNSKEISLTDWVEPLVSGSEIYITNVISHDDIFISSVCSKLYPKMFTSAAEECKLLEEIDKEQLVLAKVENEYFRAKVLEMAKGDVVKVLNVDTGHMATVSAFNIRKPNSFVQSCPYDTRRVKLMYLCNVTTPYANNKAVAQLERCQQNGAEFILKVDQNLELGIELLLNTPNRESLNKQLLPMLFEKRTELLKNTEGPLALTEITSSAMTETTSFATTTPPPSPKIIEIPETKKMYSLKDLKMIPITCGDGVTIMVLDVSTFAKQGYITGCDYTTMDFIKKLEKEYLPKVDKYCAASNNTAGYCPTVDEICLAVFESDKNWYRALCLQQMKEDTFCVMFLDYGNISSVHKSNIRPITLELMFPSNANMCTFEDLPENVTPKMCEKFNAAIQANPIIKAKVTRLEQDSYLLKLENMENYF